MTREMSLLRQKYQRSTAVVAYVIASMSVVVVVDAFRPVLPGNWGSPSAVGARREGCNQLGSQATIGALPLKGRRSQVLQ